MYKYTHTIRVRYADTDQMGYVYYGHYARYYEEARSEAIRNLGLPYRDLEASGVMLPITRMNIKYIQPAYYDDLLTVHAMLPEMPHRFINFHYKIYNEAGKLLNEAETQLIFVDATTRRMTQAPPLLIEMLKAYFV